MSKLLEAANELLSERIQKNACWYARLKAEHAGTDLADDLRVLITGPYTADEIARALEQALGVAISEWSVRCHRRRKCRCVTD